MITSKMGKNQMHGWMNHTLGATRILELRGEEQLNSDLGRFLFQNLIVVNVCLMFFVLCGFSSLTRSFRRSVR